MASMHLLMVKILLIYLMSACHKANGRCRSAKGTCPRDWNQWRDNCYKAIEPRSWSEARDECVRIGGVMATPNTLEENAYIKSFHSHQIWTNCNDLETEGIWECEEGTSTDIHFTNWAGTEPNGGTWENCAEINSQSSWNDFECFREQPAVCKQLVPPRWQ